MLPPVTSLLERYTLDDLQHERARRRMEERTEGELETLREEAARLSGSFPSFLRAAWPVIEPSVRLDWNWSIDAVCEHLEAVTEGLIHRCQVWIPPGSMKSTIVSIAWPAWEWTILPGLRYMSGSYALPLSRRLTSKSRDLIMSEWYQALWGHLFTMTKLDETFYRNDRGGDRLATAPTSTGSGVHGHRIIIDDPVNANDVEGMATAIDKANAWYDTTLSTRAANPKDHAEVIVMQRLSTRDLAQHVLEFGEDWTILCLPERYDPRHPFAYAGDRRDPSLPVRGIDQGKDALLWPSRFGKEEHRVRRAKLGEHRSAGQLQQMPASREGAILKRAGWRYFDPKALEAAELGKPDRLPRFRRVFSSWDTSFKEKSTSDYVAGGLWGVLGGDRYLLKVVHARMSLPATMTAMRDLRRWGLERWPKAATSIVIEKSANGVEILEQLTRELPGVVPYTASTDKTSRAVAAEPDFDSGNVFIPGAESVTLGDYDPARTPAWAQEVIEECAVFPGGDHDDLMDMVTMALNWVRGKPQGGGKSVSPAKRTVNLRGTEGASRGAPGTGGA